MGVDSKVREWIRVFLLDRTQKVRVENSPSEPRLIMLGVLQGLVLGPLLFLVYIEYLAQGNDGRQNLIMKILQFLDNRKVIAPHDKIEEIESLQQYLYGIYEWPDKNHMR